MIETQKIELKSPGEIATIRRIGALLRETREMIGTKVKPGTTTQELDKAARSFIDRRGAVPAFLGYQGFPATLCTSVNEEIVHGIPSDRVLREGDIVSVDFGLIKDGFYVDTAKTFPVGRIDEESRRLINVTEEALKVAISYLVPGKRLGDLSAAVQEYIETRGFSVVREYAGHGIGRQLHEDPRIPNHGKAGRGMRWQAGMVVAVEPMVNMGTHQTRLLGDKWTVVTADSQRSAHAEHTVAITSDGPEVVT